MTRESYFMPDQFVQFFKKTYIIFLVVLSSVIFFLGYNAYLVDHSLVNLKLAVDKISDARTLEDARKIKRLIAYPIKQEIAKKKLDTQSLVELEYAQDILDKAQNISQIEDAKTFLGDVISRKERERGAVLASLDTANKVILPVERRESGLALKRQEQALKKKISNTRDKDKLQGLYVELNSVYARLSEFDKAQEVSAEAIKLDPRAYSAARAKFMQAWAYKQKGSFDRAKAVFEEVAQEYADTDLGVLSKYQKADILYRQGNTQEAIRSLEDFFDKYSFLPVGQIARFRVGAIYMHDLKNYEAAAAAFNKLGDKWRKGRIAEYVGKKILPYLSKRYRNRGYYLLSQQKFQEAGESFSYAIKINPRDAQSYTGSGLSALGLGAKEDALNLTRKAVELDSDDWLCVANLGYVYVALRMYEQAEKQYKEAMLLNSRIAEVYYNLGYTYAVRSKFKEAIPLFKKAIALKRSFSFAYNNLAYSLWHADDYGVAVEELKKAIELNPDYLDAHYNLGAIYEKLASYDRALEEFEIVVRIRADFRDINKKIEELKVKAGR
jgi:tetratricopeptide (TPR) repeat protein